MYVKLSNFIQIYITRDIIAEKQFLPNTNKKCKRAFSVGKYMLSYDLSGSTTICVLSKWNNKQRKDESWRLVAKELLVNLPISYLLPILFI